MPKGTIGGWLFENGRAGGWQPDVPDYRDILFRGAKPRKAITEPVALRDEFLPPVRDQLRLGSCVGHAIRTAAFYGLRQKGEVFRRPGYDLSPLYAYYRARELEDSINEDSGAYLRDGVKGAFTYGIATEESHPYDVSKYAKKPTATADKTAKWHQLRGTYRRCLDVDDILQALAHDMPAVFGTAWYSNSDGPGGRMPLPEGRMEGGHGLCLVAGDPYVREFKFANSWGTGWGDGNGYGYIPFAFFENGWADDVWTVEHE